MAQIETSQKKLLGMKAFLIKGKRTNDNYPQYNTMFVIENMLHTYINNYFWLLQYT